MLTNNGKQGAIHFFNGNHNTVFVYRIYIVKNCYIEIFFQLKLCILPQKSKETENTNF